MFSRAINRLAPALLLLLSPCAVWAQTPSASAAGNNLSWSLKYDPKTLDPAKVDDQASEMVRYLTGGVLIRINRLTQKSEPALAASWTISGDGRDITFRLRQGLRFSDDTPLSAKDVAATLKRVLDPETASPVAEEFLSPREVSIKILDPLSLSLHLPRRIVSLEKIFDEIAIEPENRPSAGRVTAGSFMVAEYQRGEFLRLQRNEHYWKRDVSGAQLPYLSSVRLDIVANREQDQRRFIRGQYQLIDSLPAESYAILARTNKEALHDLGPSLNTEQMWFNQAGAAPLPAWEKEWFQNRVFRVAVSKAIHRADLVRIAYDGHATPASGFISPANILWHNNHLSPIRESSSDAMQMLLREGFHMDRGHLLDRQGHPVKFSILTNAGNRSREKMASMIQQDLMALGMQVNVVTLDFPALVERLMHTQAYEAALLGLANVDPDPSSMMNLWLSSSPNHQWNPGEKTPATAWEAEIDQQMERQASTRDAIERKHALDRVQQIVLEQQPFIYLVYPNMLYAVSPLLSGVKLSVFQPGVVSNIDMVRWMGSSR